MSSDDELSSVEEDPYSENQRLHSIWKSINETKNLSQMGRGTREQPVQSSEKKSPHVSFVRSRQRQSQKKEEKDTQHRENVAHLLKKLQEAQRLNMDLKSQIETVKKQSQRELQETRKQYEHKLKVQGRRLKTVEKENYQENKQDKVEVLSKEIQRLHLRIKSLQFQKRSVQKGLNELRQMNEAYSRKLSQDQTKIESEILIGKGKGEQLLQLNEANRTIERLVELLKKTQVYKQYSPLLDQAHNLHYLSNILKRLKANQLNLKPIDKKICNCSNFKINEKLVWSPTECYRILLQMKLKYDYLSEDCIEEVLFQINRIYTAREQRNLKKIREANEYEVGKLKKKLQESYDELLAKKQITRLKKQIRVMRSTQKSKAAPKLQHLKNKGQYEDQLKLKQREVKLLQERIRLFQTENGFYDKSLYYEGALWIIDKILLQVKGNEGSFKQFQINFRERIDANMQPEDWFRSYKQFFENITQINNQLVDKLFSVKESVLKKMGNASKIQQA